jgi:hypothetical protein
VKVLSGILLISLLIEHTALAQEPSDDYIRGYATALIEREGGIAGGVIEVRRGMIHLYNVSLSDLERSRIKNLLSQIDGVSGVEISAKRVVSAVGSGKVSEAEEVIVPEIPTFLPPDVLFASLLADPRWPHFSASYQSYTGNDQLNDVGAVSFGETFSIYRFPGLLNSTMELGIQAAVFSIFDLNAPSYDLVNADYFVGIPFTSKRGNFTNMFRIFHQSSHLGDEFILRGRARERINLSYENLNDILSFDLPYGFRIYAGAGYLFNQDPSDLEPWATQTGLEFRSTATWWNEGFRPVAAVDIQNHQETDWDTELSLRAGVQLENPDFLNRKMQLMFEYYNGRSPNGQFFTESIEFLGVGIHFFYD